MEGRDGETHSAFIPAGRQKLVLKPPRRGLCPVLRRRYCKGRVFDTPEAQIARNGDAGQHLVVKIDVEGAEWETFLNTPEAVLDRVDQLAVEFHGTNRPHSTDVLAKLKRIFYIGICISTITAARLSRGRFPPGLMKCCS